MKTFYSISFYILSTFLVLGIAGSTMAQNVGISTSGTYTPNAKAILDLDGGAGIGGLLVPRMTTTNRDILLDNSMAPGVKSDANGMMIFNTATKRYEMWVNTSGTNYAWKKVVNEDDLGGGSYILNQTTQQPSSNFNISNAGVIGTTLSVGNGITVGANGTGTPPGNILMSIDDSWIGTGTSATSTRMEFDKTSGAEGVSLIVDKTGVSHTAMTIKNNGAAAGVGLKLSGIRNLGTDASGFIDFENTDGTTDILARLDVRNQNENNTQGSFRISLMSTTLQQRLLLTHEGNLTITGKFNSQGIQETSDARFKKNINSISDALSTVMNLEGVTYNWRTEEFPERSFGERMEYGVIAQQIEKIVPELVATDEDGYKSVQYSHMVPLLLEAIKEQQAIINSQSQEIGVLKASVDAISELIKTAEK